jgi:hypothetical protein
MKYRPQTIHPTTSTRQKEKAAGHGNTLQRRGLTQHRTRQAGPGTEKTETRIKKPSPNTVPRRKRGRLRKDDAENQNHHVPDMFCTSTAAATASPYDRLPWSPQVRALPAAAAFASLSARASVAAAAAQGPYPGCRVLGTPYVAVASATIAASIPRPNRHKPLPSDTLPGTSTPY